MRPTKANIERLERDIDALKRIVDMTFWMSRRYASGRQTYAPGMVREAWDTIRRNPHWGLTDAVRYDDAVRSDTERARRPDGTLPGLDGDYLADCMDADKTISAR
jgi:hypothetical protein